MVLWYLLNVLIRQAKWSWGREGGWRHHCLPLSISEKDRLLLLKEKVEGGRYRVLIYSEYLSPQSARSAISTQAKRSSVAYIFSHKQSLSFRKTR